MEGEPDTENVVYLDEYPELARKVWLRRLAQQRLGENVVHICNVIPFEREK